MHLDNVLDAPQHVKNLISVRKFTTDNFCSVKFDLCGLSVKDLRSRKEILQGNNQGDLYPLHLGAVTSSLQGFIATTTSTDLWRRQLGHPCSHSIAALKHSSFISCNKSPTVNCEACQLGKNVTLPFSTLVSRTDAPFEIIHCDLWTSPLSSVFNYKYYLIILDDSTHFMWTFPLRIKSDVFPTFVRFYTYISTHFSSPLKSLQYDNGKEFDNTPLHSFLSSHSVLYRLSCPHTSQQNGKAERAIRTTNDVLLTHLYQAQLPPTYWVEAMHIATYLLNRRPTKASSSWHPI